MRSLICTIKMNFAAPRSSQNSSRTIQAWSPGEFLRTLAGAQQVLSSIVPIMPHMTQFGNNKPTDNSHNC